MTPCLCLRKEKKFQVVGGKKRVIFFYYYYFSSPICHFYISSEALYMRFITSKQKYYLLRVPFITRATRRCE